MAPILMTVEQALKLLDDVTKGINAPRETHLAVLHALQVLAKELESKKT
jgi:hypothetical protein